MVDRAEVARRHRLPDKLIDGLVGETEAEVEADAAAKGALIQMFSPVQVDAPPPPEPPVAGLPPRDKQASDYTSAEWEAVHADSRRKDHEREQEAEAERKRQEAEANRTDEQRFGDAASAALQPGAKQAAHVDLLRSLGMLGGEE